MTGLSSALLAQPSWQSNLTGKIDTVNPFKATMTSNFPTSTMLYSGDWHYEVSHRFVPPIREKGAFLGLDGGANMRMSIGYGIRDNLNLRIGRSSLHDNADLQLKYRIWNNLSSAGPSALALRIGIARNGDLPGKQQQARIWQYVAQLVYNIQWSNSPLRIGIVPSYLYNTAPYSIETQHSLIAGLYALYYLNEMWGIWIESAPLIEGYRGRLWSLENKKIKYRDLIVNKDVSKVSIIGVGMITTPGVTYRMFQTLANIGINILVISTSEIKISVLINKKNIKKALAALHKEFKLNS